MVSFRQLSNSAKKALEKAGGPDAVKQKAQKALDAAGGTEGLKKKAVDLRDVAKGGGSLSEKAKAAGGIAGRDEDHQAGEEDPPPAGRAGKHRAQGKPPKKERDAAPGRRQGDGSDPA